MLHSYDPKQVSVIGGGKVASGFGENSLVKFGRMQDAFALKIGVDGEGTRAKSNDKSGFIEITLMNSSSFNDVLSGYSAADELSGTGVVPWFIKDNSGRTLATCLNGWVKKMPDKEFVKAPNEITWRIETEELNMFIGGN